MSIRVSLLLVLGIIAMAVATGARVRGGGACVPEYGERIRVLSLLSARLRPKLSRARPRPKPLPA